MKSQKRRNEIEFVDSDFAAAMYEGGGEDESRRRSSHRQAQRKTRQFCRQVQRALNLAIEGSAADLDGVFVEEVSPAPDCGRLMVHVAVGEGLTIADALDALRRAGPQLRQEVAMTIARKRAPELFFAPVAVWEGGDRDE